VVVVAAVANETCMQGKTKYADHCTTTTTPVPL